MSLQCSVCPLFFALFVGARGLDEMGWRSMDLEQALWQLPTFIHFVVGWHWAAKNSIWAVAKMKSYWKWTLLMFCMLEMCYLGHEKFQWEEKHWLQTTRVSCQTDHLHAVLWLFLQLDLVCFNEFLWLFPGKMLGSGGDARFHNSSIEWVVAEEKHFPALCLPPAQTFHTGKENISAVSCLLDRPVREASGFMGAEKGWIEASSGGWWWSPWARRCWCRARVSGNISHFVCFALPMSRQAQESEPTGSPKWIYCIEFIQFWSLPKLEAGQVSRVDSGSKYKLCFLLRRWVWGIFSFSAENAWLSASSYETERTGSMLM